MMKKHIPSVYLLRLFTFSIFAVSFWFAVGGLILAGMIVMVIPHGTLTGNLEHAAQFWILALCGAWGVSVLTMKGAIRLTNYIRKLNAK